MSNTKQSNTKTKKDKQVGFRFLLKETKKKGNGMSTQLFSFVIITLLCLMLAYLLPYSLVLTLPFVFFVFSVISDIQSQYAEYVLKLVNHNEE